MTVHVMDDHSMTIDYDGVIEMGDIRNKLIHMVLEGYLRVYHQALQDAVAKGKVKG